MPETAELEETELNVLSLSSRNPQHPNSIGFLLNSYYAKLTAYPTASLQQNTHHLKEVDHHVTAHTNSFVTALILTGSTCLHDCRILYVHTVFEETSFTQGKQAASINSRDGNATGTQAAETSCHLAAFSVVTSFLLCNQNSQFLIVGRTAEQSVTTCSLLPLINV